MKVENIKFKAKRLDNGEWIEGEISHFENTIWIVPIHHKPFHSGCAEVAPDTICMFTGLKDCKGNEIWEHDLLQNQETKAIYEVVWDENGGFIIKNSVGGGCLLNFLGSILSVFKFKVIGNKFDRKEGEK